MAEDHRGESSLLHKGSMAGDEEGRGRGKTWSWTGDVTNWAHRPET